jgi:hypothetical protein
MKSGKGLLLFALSAGLFLYSCKKGDAGPAGPTGATGSTGNTGPQGPAGSADVIASKWFRLDSSVWTHTAADSIQYMASFRNIRDNSSMQYLDTEIDFHAVMPTPLITKSIKDSGMVLFYYKDSTGNGDAASIGTVALYHVGLMQLQTTTSDHLGERDNVTLYNESDSIGSNITFSTRWDGSDGCYNPDTYHYYHPDPIKYTELPFKTVLYFRYIVIPAAKTQRTMAPVDYKDYNAVLKYYHLEEK